MMWQSRTKADLIIEVWEKLDCESVGGGELIAIENAVRDRFGTAAVDSPMVLARMLADEGAELRHAEIMELYVERNAEGRYDAIFRNILNFSDLKGALSTIRNLENIRNKFATEDDKQGLRLLREVALRAKKELSLQKNISGPSATDRAEMANWLTIWLQSPDVFENWFALRIRAPEFKKTYGDRGELA